MQVSSPRISAAFSRDQNNVALEEVLQVKEFLTSCGIDRGEYPA